jgi:glycosyltransferase involved in cell wall biosynthesis
MAPTLSVALCTYNGARYLEEQLLSILNQTLPPTQLVVSDDASTDNTVELVQSVVADFQNTNQAVPVSLVILRNSESLGVTKNFEQAVRNCDGDLISLCDQDDRWHEHRLERMVAEFERRPELTLLHSDARLVDRGGNSLEGSLMDTLGMSPTEAREIHSGEAFKALLRRNLATGATVMFRKGLLNHAIPFFEPWVHDEWLAMLASIVGVVDFLPEQLIDYRQHGNNQIGAVKLTLLGKLRKLRDPRDERNQHLVARAESLLGRLIGLDGVVEPWYVQQVQAKLKHDRWRRDLPKVRMWRVLPVLNAAAAGKYSRFSNGLQDVLRDIVQPDTRESPR